MDELAAPQIPNRLFFRIGDVAELAGVEPHVLRFWENEFPMFAPQKTGSGQRQYRRKDVAMALEIKRLLYDEGYTIQGARKALRDKTKRKKKSPPPQSVLPFPDAPKADSSSLGEIKQELRDILALLGDS